MDKKETLLKDIAALGLPETVTHPVVAAVLQSLASMDCTWTDVDLERLHDQLEDPAPPKGVHYIDIGREIVAKIKDGEYPVGRKLPDVVEMCRTHQCTPADLTKALDWLASSGYIVPRGDRHHVLSKR